MTDNNHNKESDKDQGIESEFHLFKSQIKGTATILSNFKNLSLAFLLFDLITVSLLIAVLLLWRLRLTLFLIIMGVFIAILLNPFVRSLEKRGVKRSIASILIFLVFFIFLGSLGYIFVHPVYQGATHLTQNFPTLVKNASNGKGPVGRILKRFDLQKWAKQNQPKITSSLKSLEKPALNASKAILKGLIDLLTVFILAFFILVQGPEIFKGSLELMGEKRGVRILSLVDKVSAAISGYMLGNLIISVIAGLIVGVSLYILGVPYAAVLAIWVGLVDFLPLVGGLLAGVPTVAVALLHSLPAGIITLIIFLVYQQLENHFLLPVVMSRTTKLNSLWVLLSILIGADIGSIIGSLLGSVVGAIIAIPIAGAVQIVAKDFWENSERYKTMHPQLQIAESEPNNDNNAM